MRLDSVVEGFIAGFERLIEPKGLAAIVFFLVLVGVGPMLIFQDDRPLFIALPVSKLLLLGVMMTATPVALIVGLFRRLGTKSRPNLGIHMGVVAGTVSVAACAVASLAAKHLPEWEWLPVFTWSVVEMYAWMAAAAVIFFFLVTRVALWDAKRAESEDV